MELASSPPWPPKIPGCHRWSKAQLVMTRKVAVVPLAQLRGNARLWLCQEPHVPGHVHAGTRGTRGVGTARKPPLHTHWNKSCREHSIFFPCRYN